MQRGKKEKKESSWVKFKAFPINVGRSKKKERKEES